jgi:uncharacterized protein (TIGR00369 family)
MNLEHYQKLQHMFQSANVNSQIYKGTELIIEHGKATLSLNISNKFFHSLDAMHGSVYFKMLDDAAFFSVNSLVDDVFVLTTNFNTHLIKPVREEKVTAVGEVRFVSRNLFIAESTLYNEAGEEVAFGTGHFAKSRIALTEEIGYN